MKNNNLDSSTNDILIAYKTGRSWWASWSEPKIWDVFFKGFGSKPEVLYEIKNSSPEIDAKGNVAYSGFLLNFCHEDGEPVDNKAEITRLIVLMKQKIEK